MSHLEWIILLVWLSALGGTIGSFLNVVVYRLPAGMSLSHPGSHCPACRHPIRWHDNVPVFGWLMLRGRCRDCRAWISLRYPLVEAATALLFLSVAAVELGTHGANLPLRPVPLGDEIVLLPWTGMRLAGILAYHLLLLTTLLPMALIEQDGKPVPWRLIAPTLAIGLAAPLVWPYLHPVPAGSLQTGWIAGLLDGVAGLSLAAVLGWGAPYLPPARRAAGVWAGPACVGLVLGWQAGVIVIMATLAVHLLVQAVGTAWPGLRRLPFTGWLLLASLAWILAWRPLVEALSAISP